MIEDRADDEKCLLTVCGVAIGKCDLGKARDHKGSQEYSGTSRILWDVNLGVVFGLQANLLKVRNIL